jgi:hypothetical protein
MKHTKRILIFTDGSYILLSEHGNSHSNFGLAQATIEANKDKTNGELCNAAENCELKHMDRQEFEQFMEGFIHV